MPKAVSLAVRSYESYRTLISAVALRVWCIIESSDAYIRPRFENYPQVIGFRDGNGQLLLNSQAAIYLVLLENR